MPLTILAKLIFKSFCLVASLPQVLSFLEISAVVFALAYVYYASVQKPAAWIFGCFSAIFSFFFFWLSKLQGSAFLQLFYFSQGVLGFFNWKYLEPQRKASYRYSNTFHLLAFIAMIVVTILSYNAIDRFILDKNESPNILDIIFAVGSIWATYLETKKDIRCWWYWIACNLGYSALYLYSCFKGEQMYLYAGLMIFFTIFSIIALFRWEKDLRQPNKSDANEDKDYARNLVDQS